MVGITEVSYTKSWYVLFPLKIILFDEMGSTYNPENQSETNSVENYSEKLYISSGYYENAKKLVDEINNILGKITTIKSSKLLYNELNNIVTVEPGLIDDITKVYPFFGSEIETILGLKNRNMKNNFYSIVSQTSGIASFIFKRGRNV